ncbi:MAG: acetate--CoA ligase family protein [candidate division NC10 bacterium]|nr:acetate--CoA ligase family protein [candidate division NC10 bacterium]
MRLLEHEAKVLLLESGIPIPSGRVVSSWGEAEKAHEALGGVTVLKAQIPAGGRQKAGGVAFPRDLEELKAQVSSLLGTNLRGYPVERLLLEEWVEVGQELFLAVIYDAAEKMPLALLSADGGIEVEEMARQEPTKVVKYYFDPRTGLMEFQAREAVARLGLVGKDLIQVSGILYRAAQLFLRFDATLVEINPLARTLEERYIALDVHIELDDDALYRHPELEKVYGIARREAAGRPATRFEQRAAEIDALDHRGVAGRMIEFDGDIGLLIGGGGASLTAFDAIRRHGGRPANYCEIGGNPSVRKVAELTKLILSKPGVKRLAVIMNVVSNTRVDLVARGAIKGCLEAGLDPAEKIAVFRVPGSWEEEGFKILQKYGVPYCERTVSIDEAARRAVLAQG